MNSLAQAVYRHAPIWLQNVMLTEFATLLNRERYGGRSDEFRELLATTERYSKTELEVFQGEKLRALVAHAYETVPYYRRRFDEQNLKPSDIRGPQDLYKVPLLTRADIRTNFDDLRSRAVTRRGVKSGHTSGTTGTPLTVEYDLETVWMTYAVFDRHYQWAGCRRGEGGDGTAVARGNVIVPLSQKAPPYWRHDRSQNQLILSSFHLSPSTLPTYIDALRRFPTAVIDGYPSTLYILAKFLQSQRDTLPLKAAITSSETLYDFQREVIEERFACKVFDYYAMAERVVFSNECNRHSGHHLAMEYGLAEVVDELGQVAPAGTVGRLVGTSLWNRAMPLIRYVTNDMTALKLDACPCGRGLELMDDVTTKAEDLLTLPDGRLISPSVLTHPFKPLDCIQGSQIVQLSPDLVHIRIVPGSAYTKAHTRHLIEEFRARLGEGVHVDVEMVERLESSPSGKFKWVISKVPAGI
jgi:phenylacetate-CoA ligase